MTPKDLLLALLVIVVWGLNFVVIKVGLHGMPPMLMGALRFMLAAFPAILFVRRPQVPLRWMLAYGMTISLGQFAFLFYAMYVGMPAGLASLVLQSQAFFTLFFAALFLGERLRGSNLFGLLVAASGLVLIGLQGGQAMTLAGFALTIAAASMWALGKLPFLALSLWLEGPELIAESLRTLSLDSLLVLAYLAFGATILGYGLWSRLLSRYPASQVAPFSLLVPVVGISSSALLLGERLGSLQMVGAALVMAGLLINVWGGRLLDSWRQRTPGAV
ncbi:MAG: O-acetylserine/cysteine exporter [Gammaproteobacteria bacterium HGW-Gammaproteobacteria-12]|nr:MAG: O-acetylserine/cysteine exporter [Gammaproteobacteria bacterium HGW-Gammaproteobacteria-12]